MERSFTMKEQTIEIQHSSGRVLFAAIFRDGGKKLMAKGHLIREEDVRTLELGGMKHISVAQLEEGEVAEDEAARAVSAEIACGSYAIQLTRGGRANLTATENCCVLVDDKLLRQVNRASAVVVATCRNFSHATAGQRIASVKSAPFAVSKPDFDNLLGTLRDRGPIMQARPAREASVGVLYCDPFNSERARTLFEPVLQQKLLRFGIRPPNSLTVVEDADQVAWGLQNLLRPRPTVILVASTTAPAGPLDAVGLAMEKIGCKIERFLAPVEPGSLLLMGYHNNVPVLSAPGCFRSVEPNVIDLVLPPLIAGYRVSAWEIACLGHGGLLNSVK